MPRQRFEFTPARQCNQESELRSLVPIHFIIYWWVRITRNKLNEIINCKLKWMQGSFKLQNLSLPSYCLSANPSTNERVRQWLDRRNLLVTMRCKKKEVGSIRLSVQLLDCFYWYINLTISWMSEICNMHTRLTFLVQSTPQIPLGCTNISTKSLSPTSGRMNMGNTIFYSKHCLHTCR